MSLAVLPPPKMMRPPRMPKVATERPVRRRRKPTPVPFTLPHFRAWASDLILDTGESWHPEGFQEAFAEDLFAGFKECWLIVPEGNGKTTLLAGIALYHCEFRPFAAVHIAAASREQAETLYRQAEGFVLRSPPLYSLKHSPIQAAKGKRKTDVPRFVCLEGYRRINHHEGGRIQVFAADDRTGDSTIPTLAVIDEPHRQRDLSLYRTWSGKLMKRDGQIAAISTSGEPGSDFEVTRARIREAAKEVTRQGSFTRVVSDRIVLHEWAIPDEADPTDLKAVKAANPFSGITIPMLEEKLSSPTMTMRHWLRFVCNRPTHEVESWLGPDGASLWKSLEDPYPFEDGAFTWVGVDVALKHDTTAVVAMQRRPDGRLHAKCRIWTPTEQTPVDVTHVMQHLRDLASRYTVLAIAYDPRFFDVPAKYLFDEGLEMVEIPQTQERMTMAVGGLYEAIVRGQVTHDHHDPITGVHDDARVFTTQVLNAVPRYNERGYTLVKERSQGRIDAAIALALAHDRSQRVEEAVWTAA